MAKSKTTETVFAAGFIADQRGSNAVEFALLAPIVLFFMLGTIYLGIYLGIAHSLQEISSDSSRYAMVGITKTERETLAKRWVTQTLPDYPLLSAAKMTTPTIREDTSKGSLTVTVHYDISYMAPPQMIASVIGLGQTLERSATVMVP